ncbi:MAG: S-layer homology domain-containing protein [Thermodesulfovibrionales bacterium]
MRRMTLWFGVIVCCLLMSAVSRAATVDVSMQDFSFSPQSITVSVGDTVRWTNNQGTHTATSGTNCSPDGTWDSGILAQSQSFSRTFTEAGTFPYFCSLHCGSGMTGTVVVNAAPPASALLTVAKAGVGEVGVTSSPAGISCGTDCTETFTGGTVVTLTAAAIPGTTFTGWSGACRNTDTTCVVTLTAETLVTAHSLATNTTTFGDAPQGYWAGNYIEALHNNSLTQGCGAGNFCPETPVMRGQMAAFIVRAQHGEDFTFADTPFFSDVPSTDGYFKYVQKLKEDGITKVNDVYGVNDDVTRGEAAALLVRAKYGDTFVFSPVPHFSDVPADHPFFSFIQKLKDDGITTVSDTYGPDEPVTRAQAAAFLGRAFLGMQ